MRRRTLVLPALAAAGLLVLAGAVPAFAAAPTPHPSTTVAGVGGTIADVALSPDGGTGYVIDQTAQIAIFDTATNQVTAHSLDFATAGYGTPSSLSVATDGRVYVTAGSWLVILNPDGTQNDLIGLPTTQFRSVSPVPGSTVTAVASPGGPTPTSLYRWNIGFSISPIPFAPSPSPDSLGAVAVGPGTGNDNDVLVAGTAGGAGVLYIFDSPFALAGPAFTVALPGTSSAADVALNAAGTQALVTAPADGTAFLVDVATGTVQATLTTPTAPIAATFSADGATAYLAGGAGVSVVDTAAGTVTGSVTTDATQLVTLAVSPSGNRLWAGDDVPGGAVHMLSSSAVTSAGTTSGTAGFALSTGFTASGFDLPVTYALSAALPAGLALDAATGVVSGTPTDAVPATTYTVTASSSDGDVATTTWTLEVAAASGPAPTTPPAPGQGPSLAESGPAPVWPPLALGAATLLGGAVLLTAARRPGRARR